MKFREGDKVKFVNENLSGEVVSIRNNQVYVRIEDGFEIPATESQLVLIDGVQGTKTAETPEGQNLSEGLYLLFYPQQNQSLRVSLANYSGSRILCSLNKVGDHGLQSAYMGMIENQLQVNVDTLNTLHSRNWPLYHIQVLFQPDDELLPPFQRSYQPEVSILDRQPKKIGGRDAIVMNLEKLNAAIVKSAEPDISRQALNKLQHKDFTELPQIENKLNPLTGSEVDLHIEKIEPEWRKMGAANIITMQLMYASKALDTAYSQGKDKLVLIHGNGSGTLRAQLLKMLSKHEAVRSTKPADPLHYGGGAIEVKLK